MKVFGYIFLFINLFSLAECTMTEFVPTLKECEHKYLTDIASINNAPLVEKFKIGCKNATSLDATINIQLLTIASDPCGATTLRTMAAMINPYVECANSLESFVDSIPVDKVVTPQAMIEKAKKIVHLYKTLGVQERSFSDVIKPENSIALFQTLKDNPVIFLPAVPEDILTTNTFTDNKASLIFRMNLFWNSDVANSVKSVLPFLREKMFAIEIGARSEYRYNRSTHSYVIYLSPAPLSAYCITSTSLGSRIGASFRHFVHSYAAEKQDFDDDIKLLHEMSHHFTMVLTSDLRDDFDEIIPILRRKGVDTTYVLLLPEIFNGFSEFQNITGIIVKNGHLHYNKCSEGAYVLSKRGFNVRCTHTSKRFFNVPVGLVKLIQEEAEFIGVHIDLDSIPVKLEGFIGWRGF